MIETSPDGEIQLINYHPTIIYEWYPHAIFSMVLRQVINEGLNHV